MRGAVLGDLIGSSFAEERNDRAESLPHPSSGTAFTDVTVLTAAVGEALLSVPRDAGAAELREAAAQSLRQWQQQYPQTDGGVLAGTESAAAEEQRGEQNSGIAAACITAAGWLYESPARTREAARCAASAISRQPGELRAAEAIAAVIYLARTGAAKDEIRIRIEREFGYGLVQLCEKLRLAGISAARRKLESAAARNKRSDPGTAAGQGAQRHLEVAAARVEQRKTARQEAGPRQGDGLPRQNLAAEAIAALLTGVTFEEVLHIAAWFGGGSNRVCRRAAMAGGMAEAMFGVPAAWSGEYEERLPEEIDDVLCRLELEAAADSNENFDDSDLEELVSHTRFFHYCTSRVSPPLPQDYYCSPREAKFARKAAEVYRAGILDWEQNYDNPRINDGVRWQLEIAFDDRKTRRFFGSNSYPKNWSQIAKIFEWI